MKEYEDLWQFPNVCGAMDGKHVIVRCPRETGSQFFNYKKSSSTILLAVVDARYNFIYIDIGTNGRANDASVFSKSDFNAALESNTLDLPSRGIFVADDAFPLRVNIMKPFARCGQLNETQRIFNYRLSRARRVVENTFGILVSKFRIFERPIPLLIGTTEKLVRATCALHNWLRKTSDRDHPYLQRNMISVEDWHSGQVIPGTAIDSTLSALQELPQSQVENHFKAASRVREEYAERFMTTDIVPWQWKMI